MDALFSATFAVLVGYAVGLSICYPPEWEASVNLLGGFTYGNVSQLQSGDMRSALSNSLKKTTLYGNITTGNTTSFYQNIVDYGVSPPVQYEIIDGKCTTTSPFTGSTNCLPANAQMKGKSSFGHPGHTLGLTEYSYTEDNGAGTQVAGVVGMTDRNDPVYIEQTGTVNGGSFMQTLVYMNNKRSVSNPAVFDIPPSCHKPQPMTMTTNRQAVCMPQKWSTKLKLWGSVSVTSPEGKVYQSLSSGNLQMYIDYTLHKQVTKGQVTQFNTTADVYSIQDWSDHDHPVRYEIEGNTCKKEETYGSEISCIPDDAKRGEDFVWGDYLSSQNLSTYEFKDGNFNVRIALSNYNGVNMPSIQEQLITLPGTDALQTLLYNDVQLGITDPSIFDIPSICTSQAANEVPHVGPIG